jgi:hypothetical protein
MTILETQHGSYVLITFLQYRDCKELRKHLREPPASHHNLYAGGLLLAR